MLSLPRMSASRCGLLSPECIVLHVASPATSCTSSKCLFLLVCSFCPVEPSPTHRPSVCRQVKSCRCLHPSLFSLAFAIPVLLLVRLKSPNRFCFDRSQTHSHHSKKTFCATRPFGSRLSFHQRTVTSAYCSHTMADVLLRSLVRLMAPFSILAGGVGHAVLWSQALGGCMGLQGMRRSLRFLRVEEDGRIYCGTAFMRTSGGSV